MRRPIIALKDQRRSRGQHAGLLLQRYLCEDATGKEGNPEEKRAVLDAAIHAAGHQEVQQLYQAAFNRWKESLPAGTKLTALQSPGRLIVGLGSENVLETGIRLHHTYGLPILPGSALKGLSAHYCAQVWGAVNEDFKNGDNKQGKCHQLLFGNTDDSGCIVFHDAWFVPDSAAQPLKLDVMTPHHPEWLDGNVAPTDFDSPIPVPFLSVAGSFQVAVTWHGPIHPDSGRWTELALSLVKEALAEWGIGGKTSSGYGRLVDPATVPLTPQSEPQKPPVSLPRPGDRVEAVLLKEKTTKGGWKAKHEPSGLSGPVQNSGDVPGDNNSGDRLELIVAIARPREIAFRYPTAADEQRAKNPPAPHRGGNRNPPRRRPG